MSLIQNLKNSFLEGVSAVDRWYDIYTAVLDLKICPKTMKEPGQIMLAVRVSEVCCDVDPKFGMISNKEIAEMVESYKREVKRPQGLGGILFSIGYKLRYLEVMPDKAGKVLAYAGDLSEAQESRI